MTVTLTSRIDPDSPTVEISCVLAELKDRIGKELRAYPYPIAGCDEVFKTLAQQKECCRIALAGIAGDDGLVLADAVLALRELLATPIALTLGEQALLSQLAGQAS